MRCSSAGVYAPGGSTFWVIRTVPVAVLSPASTWAGFPFTRSSATTKISPRAGSITGVPVIPTVGLMSPQGSDDAGHRGGQVPGPDDRAGAGGQRVHRVVLGRHEHPAAGDQRFAVKLAVERGDVHAGELVSTGPGSMPVPEPAGSP